MSDMRIGRDTMSKGERKIRRAALLAAESWEHEKRWVHDGPSDRLSDRVTDAVLDAIIALPIEERLEFTREIAEAAGQPSLCPDLCNHPDCN